jgi:hypothetical protein
MLSHAAPVGYNPRVPSSTIPVTDAFLRPVVVIHAEEKRGNACLARKTTRERHTSANSVCAMSTAELEPGSKKLETSDRIGNKVRKGALEDAQPENQAKVRVLTCVCSCLLVLGLRK